MAKAAPAPEIRILHGEIEMVSVTDITPHPDNARKGDIAEIADSIRQNGFYGYLMAQRSSRRILAGNNRYLAGVSVGMTKFPVNWLDVDDDEALSILSVDNATSDKAKYHEEKQVELLAKLAMSRRGLKGSGHNEQTLDALKDKLLNATARREEAAAKKKAGEGDDRFAIILVCDDPRELQMRYEDLVEKGWNPRKTILNERTKIALG